MNNNDENRIPQGDNVVAPVVNPYLSRKKELQPTTLKEDRTNGTIAAAPDAPVYAPLQEIADEKQSKMKILPLLQRDYEELQKQSVKACLRSKAFPCSEVSDFLEQNTNLDLAMLREDYQTLLEHEDYLGLICEETTKTKSSLWFMTRLGTAIRFLQILVIAEQLEIQEASQMIAVLLKKLTARIESLQENGKELSQQSSQPEDDDEDLYSGSLRDYYHPPQIACFGLAFLLRIKTKVLDHRPHIMAPLWRALDGIAVSFASNVPSPLLQDSIGALFRVLKGFLQMSLALLAQPEGGNQSVHPQQFKMISFSMTRLESFLKIYSTASGDLLDVELVENILNLLLCFRGLAVIGQTRQQSNSHLLDQLAKLAAKADKCVLPMLLLQESKKDGPCTTLHLANLKLLYEMAISTASNSQNLWNEPQGPLEDIQDALQLIKPTTAIGKVQVLQQLLHRAIVLPSMPSSDGSDSTSLLTKEKSVNIALAICEHLLFVGLPMCHNLLVSPCLKKSTDNNLHELLDKSLHCVSHALYLIETSAPCMTHNTDRGITSLHRLLLRWLMPWSPKGSNNTAASQQQHPFARECVIATVHFHAARLYMATGSPEGMPLLALVTKALFDPRTWTCHRGTLATLIREIILVSQPEGMSKVLQQLVCDEYCAKRPLTRKKRKRGKEKGSKSQGKLLRTWHYFTFEDLQIIGSVLALIPFSSIQNSSADVECFCTDSLQAQSNPSRRPRRMQRNDINNAILVFAVLGAAVKESPTTDCLRKLSGGLEVSVLHNRICTWFLALWDSEFDKGKRKHTDSKRMRKLAAIGTTILRFLVLSSDINASSIGKATKVADVEFIKSLYRVLDLCTGDNLSTDLSGDGKPSASTTLQTQLVLEAIGCIQVFARTSQLDVDADIAQGFARIFQRLFETQSCCWSQLAHMIDSFFTFSQSLSKTRKEVLANCIPTHMKPVVVGLLQSRLKGKVYRYGKRDKTTRMNLSDLLKHCSRELEALVCPDSLSAHSLSIFDDEEDEGMFSTNPVSISLGSYFVTAPTQEGRRCTVIFPPGKASLRDIKYMLGASQEDEDDADEAPGMRQLRRVTVSQDGSCLALLN